MSDAVKSTDASEALYKGSQQRTLLGHPIGLSICFLTEMWERFSYYGMRAILILYLVQYLKFSSSEGSLILGTYIGLVYMLPIVGGWLADRYLGARKAVTYGAILLVAGHITLAFEGPPGVVDGDTVIRSDFYMSVFFLALALIITGVGFLKANISTIVGSLYGPDDPRRDGGFTIFYMGINLGSLTSILMVGYVAEKYGWGYGFGLAGIVMLLGLLIFLLGQPLLEGRADPPNPADLKKRVFGPVNKEWAIYLSGLALVGVSFFLVQSAQVTGYLLYLSCAVMVGIVLWYGYTKCTDEERDRLLVVCVLIAAQVVFWSLFEQQAASLTLLADQQFDLNVFGIQFFASQVQFLNPLFIVIGAPALAWCWVWLSKRGWEPSTPGKFTLCMLLTGLGYVVTAYGLIADEGSSKSFLWLVWIYFAMTMAELCLSPVGLSMITKMSPARIVGMMMGTWFLFISLGNFLAGVISSLTGGAEHGAGDGGLLDVAATSDIYYSVGILSIAVAAVLLVLTPWLKRRMHGIH